MADKGSFSFFLSVCVVSCLVVNADYTASATVGQLFVYELQREVFQSEFRTFQTDFIPYLTHYGPINIHPMAFKCSKEMYPDLPRWLRFTQRETSENGFLYGTPLEEDVGRNTIELVIVNKQTYDTFKDRLVITVTSPGKFMPYQAEFFMPLREIEIVLPSTVREDIMRDVQDMWGTENLEFVNITSALDRGGRVPLPLLGHFEGVYVKVGTDQYFSECLLRLQSSGHRQQCEATGTSKEDCSVCWDKSNCVNWCKSVLFDLSIPVIPTPAPTPGSGILDADDFYDPPDSLPSREFWADYLVTVIVPLVLALILCLILTYIMCCRREGVEKRDAKTPEIQLYHQRTIHNNSDELREMAGGRVVPPPLSTLPMFNAHTGERMPPLQRPFGADSSQIPLIMAQEEPNTDTLPR
ncbi:alpha-sarcoglycan [Conger conger]|uniref:alpha-sarcoglycan n=1 Tax=Conger conger TaxID=82655 RepID=UPI002A5A9A36|nr:alpha-sarcoglycan [Conger conger]